MARRGGHFGRFLGVQREVLSGSSTMKKGVPKVEKRAIHFYGEIPDPPFSINWPFQDPHFDILGPPFRTFGGYIFGWDWFDEGTRRSYSVGIGSFPNDIWEVPMVKSERVSTAISGRRRHSVSPQ